MRNTRVVATRVLVLLIAPLFSSSVQSQQDTSKELTEAVVVFAGKVIGPDGLPFAGAKIRLFPIKHRVFSAESGRDVRATSDEEGRFRFTTDAHVGSDGLLTRRRALIVASANGLVSDWTYTLGRLSGDRQTSAPSKKKTIELQLGEIGPSINGRLSGPDGKPLANAKVEIAGVLLPHDFDEHVERERKASFLASANYKRRLNQPSVLPNLTTATSTDKEGRFSLSGTGKDRFVLLKVASPEIVTESFIVMTRESPDVDTRLDLDNKPTSVIHGATFERRLREKGLVVRGRVVDKKTRKPIVGMRVGRQVNVVTHYNADSYPEITDPQGRFTVSGLSPRASQRIVAVAGRGLPYQTAWVDIKKGETLAEVEIECETGIPYRLKVVDQLGKPVAAEISYVDLHPNPLTQYIKYETHWPVSRVAANDTGVYEGFALPGPGAILIKASQKFRPARVDAQAFFADSVGDMEIKDFGTTDTLNCVIRQYRDTWWRSGTIFQNGYDGIVLLNPAPDSKSLELVATLVRDRPRQISLIDSEGKPVVGAKMKSTGRENPLHTSTFPLGRLHPDRKTNVIFLQEERKLIALLETDGKSDEPITVRMEPWATATARMLDEKGQPSDSLALVLNSFSRFPTYSQQVDLLANVKIEKLVPGIRYDGQVYRSPWGNQRTKAAIRNLVFKPGENRNLGDIRIEPADSADGSSS